MPHPITVGDGHAVWGITYRRKGRLTSEVWAAPRRGGPARRVAAMPSPVPPGLPGGSIDTLHVAGGEANWDYLGPGGVYHAPLAGGPARLLPGTEGQHIAGWPWSARLTGRPRQPPRATRSARSVTSRPVNGAAPRLSPGARWQCGPTWCTGNRSGSPDPKGGTVLAQRRDGSRGHPLPTRDDNTDTIPGLDRFAVLGLHPHKTIEDPDSVVVHDLATGNSGDLGIRPTKNGGFRDPSLFSDYGSRIVSTSTEDGEMLIVNLAAIE